MRLVERYNQKRLKHCTLTVKKNEFLLYGVVVRLWYSDALGGIWGRSKRLSRDEAESDFLSVDPWALISHVLPNAMTLLLGATGPYKEWKKIQTVSNDFISSAISNQLNEAFTKNLDPTDRSSRISINSKPESQCSAIDIHRLRDPRQLSARYYEWRPGCKSGGNGTR